MTPDEWPHIRSIAKWVLPVLVGPRMARTGASERGAIMSNVAARQGNARFLRQGDFRPLLTLFRHHGCRVDVTKPCASASAVASTFLASPRLEERGPARATVQHGRLGFIPAASGGRAVD